MDNPAETSEEVAVEEIHLARGRENGEPGRISASFATIDIPIFCLINLSSAKSVTIKMNLVAVSAGVKRGTVVFRASYKTSRGQNRVWFKAQPERASPPGKNIGLRFLLTGERQSGI